MQFKISFHHKFPVYCHTITLKIHNQWITFHWKWKKKSNTRNHEKGLKIQIPQTNVRDKKRKRNKKEIPIQISLINLQKQRLKYQSSEKDWQKCKLIFNNYYHFLSIYLYTLAVSPSLGGSRQHIPFFWHSYQNSNHSELVSPLNTIHILQWFLKWVIKFSISQVQVRSLCLQTSKVFIYIYLGRFPQFGG